MLLWKSIRLLKPTIEFREIISGKRKLSTLDIPKNISTTRHDDKHRVLREIKNFSMSRHSIFLLATVHGASILFSAGFVCVSAISMDWREFPRKNSRNEKLRTFFANECENWCCFWLEILKTLKERFWHRSRIFLAKSSRISFFPSLSMELGDKRRSW